MTIQPRIQNCICKKNSGQHKKMQLFIVQRPYLKERCTLSPHLAISLCPTNQDSLIDQSKKVVKTLLRIRYVYEKSNIRMGNIYLIKKLAQILSLKKSTLHVIANQSWLSVRCYCSTCATSCQKPISLEKQENIFIHNHTTDV